jgi:hypothetical protein
MNVNAYAANAANMIGMTVAGMLMIRLLRNAPPMSLPLITSSQAVHRQGLAVHCRPPAVARVDQVAVVVPLQVGDVVLTQEREQGIADVGVSTRCPGTAG